MDTKNERSRHTYCSDFAAFDIETTSYIDDGEKKAIVYSYCFQIGDEITILRTAEEYQQFIKDIVDKYEVSPSKRFVIYVHNFAYEWQFIKFLHEWDLDSIFSNGSALNVIRACTVEGIEFRCSFALTNASLKTVGEMVGVPKMVGDLDYSLMRHSRTELTSEEIGYIENDVKIITALIRQKLVEDDFSSIPMTKTGYVRRTMREVRKGRSEGAKEYRDLIKQLILTPETYSLAREAFSGGYTHANGSVAGQTLHNVVAYDLGSSYPSSLSQFTFPMGRFERVAVDSAEDFDVTVGNNRAILDITLLDFTSRYSFPPISASKARELHGETLDNGRVWSAEKARVIVTDVDFGVIRRAYEIDSLEVNGIWIAESGYLPTQFIEHVLEFYRQKTTLKGVEGAEDQYRLAKENVNSIYGMVATDPYRVEFTAHEDLTITGEVGDLTEAIANHNGDKKRFLYYPWGTWCTAWSRWVLQTAIYDLEDAGVTVAYCDTDSIYAVDSPEIESIITRANADITRRLEDAAKHHGWDDKRANELLQPQDRHGEPHPLGIFECETPEPLEAFKTLGAKRYAKKSAKGFSITVAGLSKSAAEYVNTHGGFEFFTDGMTVPVSHSGRVTHHYSDDIAHNLLTDYNGVTDEVYQHGFINLTPAEYHMALSPEYDQFIEMLMEGRLN